MDELLLAARLLLALVFVVAGISKLIDRVGARQGLRDFGAPKPLVGPASVLLPMSEVGVGIALIRFDSAKESREIPGYGVIGGGHSDGGS